MIVGKWVSQAICTAAELGIADLLKDGPLSAAEIAAKTRASEDGVYRLLRALVQVGLFVENASRHFALAPLGIGLRSDVPGSVRGFARFLGHDLNSRPSRSRRSFARGSIGWTRPSKGFSRFFKTCSASPKRMRR
jgi:hypothetical protein